MSDLTVSALQGRATTGTTRLREGGLRGMISLRGDLADAKLQSLCTGLTGVDFPGPGTAHCVDQKGLAWMSPDEVLILLPYDTVADCIDKIEAALAGKHHQATNVSDARAVFILEGPDAAEALAKLAPVDLHPDTFRPGDFRRTRLGQVAAAFWKRDAQSFEIICFRSVAHYAFDLLADAARPDARVGVFPAP